MVSTIATASISAAVAVAGYKLIDYLLGNSSVENKSLKKLFKDSITKDADDASVSLSRIVVLAKSGDELANDLLLRVSISAKDRNIRKTAFDMYNMISKDKRFQKVMESKKSSQLKVKI
jgi:hypothetical protein